MTKEPISRRAAALLFAALAALCIVTRVQPTNATVPIGTFTSYTPVLSATSVNPSAAVHARVVSPALGTNGTSYGRYVKIGHVVVADFVITFGANSNPGSGAYRISLPVPVSKVLRSNGGAVGYGHEHEASQGYLGLGPGAYRNVIYHVNTNVDQLHAGLVIGENPRAATPDDPNINLSPMFNDVQTDQTSDSAPWVWAQGDQIIGTLVYESAN